MKTATSYDFHSILSNFWIKGAVCEISEYGSGHINNTFYIKNSDIGEPDYLLQRINNHIFKDIPALIENIRTVSDHLREKLIPVHGVGADQRVLTLIGTKDQKYYYKDESENFWRVFLYLKDTNSYDLITTEQQAYQGGSAFGKFQFLLSDLDPQTLTETIPNFYNLEDRLLNLQKAVNEDLKGRVKECYYEISYINEYAGVMRTTFLIGKKTMPLRITHNDTKFNNVLLDKNDIAQCIIDLDTVMPGYLTYDFGDAMRTIVNTASEDEKDLNKININLRLFEAYTKGYLKEVIFFLEDAEINALMDWVLLVTYMQAVRFLTDYIEGDKYYKIHFAEHNFQRTKAQLELLKKLVDHGDMLSNIIQETVATYKKSDIPV